MLLQSSVKDEEGAGGAALAASHVQRLLQQLREMRLEEQLGSELVTSLADPQGAGLRQVSISTKLGSQNNTLRV